MEDGRSSVVDDGESFAPFKSWFKIFASKEDCLKDASSDPPKFLKSFRSQIKQQDVKASYARWKKPFKDNIQLVKALVDLHNEFAAEAFKETMQDVETLIPNDAEITKSSANDVWPWKGRDDEDITNEEAEKMPSLVGDCTSTPVEEPTAAPRPKIDSEPLRRFHIDPADSEFGISFHDVSGSKPKPNSYIRPQPRIETQRSGMERFSQLCERLPLK